MTLSPSSAPLVIFVTSSVSQPADHDAGAPLALTAGIDGTLLIDAWCVENGGRIISLYSDARLFI